MGCALVTRFIMLSGSEASEVGHKQVATRQ